jgi:hypothetical protein
MASFRITFSKVLMGLPFPLASIRVQHARSAERAVRAAELTFMRRSGLGDWHERADMFEVEPVAYQQGSS